MTAETVHGTGSHRVDDALLTRWIEVVNADPEFLLVSRWSNLRLTLHLGSDQRTFVIEPQRLGFAADGTSADAAIVLAGSSQAWNDFLLPVPSRHNHHVLAMDRVRADFTIVEGRHQLIQNLRVLDVVFELLRQSTTESGAI